MYEIRREYTYKMELVAPVLMLSELDRPKAIVAIYYCQSIIGSEVCEGGWM